MLTLWPVEEQVCQPCSELFKGSVSGEQTLSVLTAKCGRRTEEYDPLKSESKSKCQGTWEPCLPVARVWILYSGDIKPCLDKCHRVYQQFPVPANERRLREPLGCSGLPVHGSARPGLTLTPVCKGCQPGLPRDSAFRLTPAPPPPHPLPAGLCDWPRALALVPGEVCRRSAPWGSQVGLLPIRSRERGEKNQM